MKIHTWKQFDIITHLIGVFAALVGLILLVILAAKQGDPWKIVSLSIYGATLFWLYIASVLYHSLNGKAKAVFQKLDHISIYLLIAGTYTPFTLVTLRGGWGWSIFGVVWGLAVLGIFIDLLFKDERRILPLIIYLSMGWLIIIAIKPLLQVLPLTGFLLLFVGGIIYSFGVIFFALDNKFAYFHGIWHLFVLAGSLSHYFTVFFYLL